MEMQLVYRSLPRKPNMSQYDTKKGWNEYLKAQLTSSFKSYYFKIIMYQILLLLILIAEVYVDKFWIIDRYRWRGVGVREPT
jgi:hypothetical protein